MVDLTSVEAACGGSVTGQKTHEDQSWAFRRFREYLDSVGLAEYYFLTNFTKGQSIKILGAFAMAMCDGGFSRPAYDTLVESTIIGAI